MREHFAKAFKSNAKAGIALLGLIVLGVAVGSYILSNQRLNPPEWVPIVGEDTFELKAQLDSAQGILPGQGQAVNISGVKVGDIASVDLVEGKAVATLRIEDRFSRVYPDATILLRPKTGLKDMVVELDPGSKSAGEQLDDGETLSNASSLPDANPDEFFASLDGDTQAYLRLLLGDAGRALSDGGSHDLANTLRRLQPLSRDFNRATRYVSLRREKVKRVTHNLSAIVSELGAHDQQLARFVGSSASVFRRFANQNDNLAETARLLPGTLRTGNTALAKIDRLGQALEQTLGDLRPTARALGPTLRQFRPFAEKTTPVLRDQLRPFAREVQPIVAELRPPARDLAEATPDLMDFTEVFNSLLNELAYDPPGKGKGKNGFLFFLPWANHNTNSVMANADGISPLRRALLLISCPDNGNIRQLFTLRQDRTDDDPSKPETLPPADPVRTLNPGLTTLVELLQLPSLDPSCPTELKEYQRAEATKGPQTP
jgi:phospholipid/cholesterol/gamma-HCH transport system substrate-binding protein